MFIWSLAFDSPHLNTLCYKYLFSVLYIFIGAMRFLYVFSLQYLSQLIYSFPGSNFKMKRPYFCLLWWIITELEGVRCIGKQFAVVCPITLFYWKSQTQESSFNLICLHNSFSQISQICVLARKKSADECRGTEIGAMSINTQTLSGPVKVSPTASFLSLLRIVWTRHSLFKCPFHCYTYHHGTVVCVSKGCQCHCGQ